jgi:hypothetical protein
LFTHLLPTVTELMDQGAMLLPSGLDRRVDSLLTLGSTVSIHSTVGIWTGKTVERGIRVIDRIVGAFKKDQDKKDES